MDLRQLEQFDEIARLGTVSAAAQSLHISQPALSRSIARLEAELGVELFERQGRKMTLSRAGRASLEYVRSILHEERLMRLSLDEFTQRMSALSLPP